MYRFSRIERVVHQYKLSINSILAPIRRRLINNTDFSIISNNCWGGICYEYYGLPKLSPTVGMYFYAEDYIEFIKNIRHYVSTEIEIVNASDSKHYDELKAKGQDNVPVGILDNVEIIFLHYKKPEIAKSKWDERVKRINWDNLIFKFSYMNDCTDELIDEFEIITKDQKSFVFANRQFPEYENEIAMPYLQDDGQIGDDTFYWNRKFDVTGFLNTPKEEIKQYWNRK